MPYFTVATWAWTLVLLPIHTQISGCHLPISLTLRIDNCGISGQLPVLPDGNPESNYFLVKPELTWSFTHCDPPISCLIPCDQAISLSCYQVLASSLLWPILLLCPF